MRGIPPSTLGSVGWREVSQKLFGLTKEGCAQCAGTGSMAPGGNEEHRRACGKCFGRGYRITGKAAAGKRVGRPFTSFDREKVRKLRNQGKSIRQIAAATGVSRSTIEREVRGLKAS